MIVNLEQPTRKDAILVYLNLLYKFHKLTDKELTIFIVLLEHYLMALEEYKHPGAASKLFMDYKVMSSELGMNLQVFKNYLTALRKKNVILKDGSLAPILIPEFNKKGILILGFNIKALENG